MKTRLLALVLACLMVLSVMPVVAFAEDFCELSSQVDGDHTLATCPDGEYIKTVEPQCGTKWGYDLFKCPACGEFFADNFVEPDHDAHALELVAKGTASTCKVAGVSAKYECLNCPYEEGGEALPLLDHDWQQIGTATGGCTSASQLTFKCSLCGETKTEGTKNEHSWITPPVIEKESKLDENGNLVSIGWGIYTCQLCQATKKVIVLHDCTLEKVDAKAATCIENGNIEYWQCTNSDCGKRFATNDATGTVLTDADIITTAGAHKLTKVEAKPATCNKETQQVNPGNIEYWECELCGKNFADENATTELTDDEIVDGDHAWRELGYVAPTCDLWGGYRYICGNCGFIKNNDPEEPLGHTTWDDATSTNKNETWTSCQEGGERTWDCGRCGEGQKAAVAAHTLYKAEFSATCTNFAYSFNYCTVCDATNQAATATHKNVVYDLSVPVLDAEGNYTYDANGKMIRTLYVVVGEITYGETLDPTNHNWIVRDTNAPTCTTDGDRVWYCPDCANTFYTEVVPAFHSKPQGDPVADVAATCTTDAYKTYLCQVCKTEYTITEVGTATGHSSELAYVATVAPTCSTKGYDLYACTHENCTYTAKRNETAKIEYVLGTFYTEIEGDNSYAQRDEYKDEFVGYYKDSHPNAEKKDVHIQGDCTKLGLYRYYCADCETYILVAMPGTGLGHQNDGDYLDSTTVNGVVKNEAAAKDPTCTEDGATHAFVCMYCGFFTEATVIDKTNHKDADGNSLITKVTDVPADKCDIGYWYCSACEKMFSDAEGKSVINDFVDHETEALDGRALTCTKFSYQHYACKNCKYEFINNYADAPDHNWVKTEGKAPTCVEDGVKDLWVCDRTICDEAATGGYVDPEHDGSVIPATGIHKNSDDREFTDKCTDTETNRTCVVCKDYIERKHHYADPVYVDATCVDYGYNLYICVDCHEDYLEQVAEKTDHNWGAWTPVEGNPNMEERFCQTDRCDAREERKIADIEYFVEIENALGNVGYTDSSLIAVTIKIKADSPLWGVRLNVKYDENLTFVGAEGISEKLNRNFDANDNNGYVTIAAGASNSTDKKPANVTIEGKEDLAVLYFRVTLPLDETTGLPTVGVAKTTTTITVEPVDASDKDHKALYALGDNETIEILPFMDVNLDGDVNMNDALFMYEILLAVDDDNIATDYEVALDIDKNGAIEYADYVALYRYLVHAWTYEYMTQIGVPAEELA